MEFLNNRMQSVGQHLYTLPHFLRKSLWKPCLVRIKSIPGMGVVIFALVNVANTDLLIGTIGKVCDCFAFFVYMFIFPFVLLALYCACLGALQYRLDYIYKCEASTHKSTCYWFFARTKQPHTFPMICSNPCATAMFKASSQQLQAIRMANTGTSTVDMRPGTTFLDHRPHTMHQMCSYTRKTFNLDFQRNVQAVLGQKFPCRQNRSGSPLNN